jgi:hypothetical protein
MSGGTYKKEKQWDIKVVGSADRKKCLKQPVRNVRRNAKFLLNPVKTGQSIAKIVFLSARTVEPDKAIKSKIRAKSKRFDFALFLLKGGYDTTRKN